MTLKDMLSTAASIARDVAQSLATADAPEAPLEINAKTIGELIRVARMEREMPRRALASAVGVSDWQMSMYEEDRIGRYNQPNFDQLVQIKSVLNISADSMRPFFT